MIETLKFIIQNDLFIEFNNKGILESLKILGFIPQVWDENTLITAIHRDVRTKKAAIGSDAIIFDYTDLEGKRTKNRHAIILDKRRAEAGHGYYLTFDLKKDDFRSFRTAKMSDVKFV